MIRHRFILLSLAAIAALTVLSACDNPMSSPSSPDPGISATGPTNGVIVAQDHGGGNGNGGGNNGQASCPAAGNNVEIEGTIKSRGATSILVHQQGRKDFLCLVNRVTTIRKGNKTYTLTQLQNGWRVHVKGTSQAKSISSVSCTATAREIKVQNTITH